MVYRCSKDKKKGTDKEEVVDNFVAVSVTPALCESGLSIRLPNGIIIEGIDQHSIALVGKLAQQL